MDAINVIKARVKVEGIRRRGTIATFPDGSRWFSFHITRGRSCGLWLHNR